MYISIRLDYTFLSNPKFLCVKPTFPNKTTPNPFRSDLKKKPSCDRSRLAPSPFFRAAKAGRKKLKSQRLESFENYSLIPVV